MADAGTERAPVVLGLAIYPDRLAGTRLRLTQHLRHFEAQGVDCRLWTFLAEDDLADWYGASTLGRVRAVLRGVARIPRAIREIARADVVIVQRECLPLGPPLLERFAARRAHLIWDVDDSVWVPYTSPTAGWVTRFVRTSERKHDAVCRRAAEVWAGSDAIREWAEARNPNVVLVPTVVPVAPERPTGPRRPVALWVGSHSTVPHIEWVLPAAGRAPSLESVVTVGGTAAPTTAVAVIDEPWSLEAEERWCRTARVGLYPIDPTIAYAQGKSGLKAILYMANGLPAVVSPTRPNRAIVRDAVDGLHASSEEEWAGAVERLLTDDDLWERCSRQGHARAREEYSVEAWAPRLLDRIRNLLGSPA